VIEWLFCPTGLTIIDLPGGMAIRPTERGNEMYDPDEIMDCCGDYADECKCDTPFSLSRQESHSTPLTLPVSYPCGHTISILAGKSLPANCAACAIGIPEGATQCEDYPCCGHTDGGGCIPRPEFTSEYWSELDSSLRARGLDDYDIDNYYEMLDRQEYGY
jgi:hypothetical protein